RAIPACYPNGGLLALRSLFPTLRQAGFASCAGFRQRFRLGFLLKLDFHANMALCALPRQFHLALSLGKTLLLFVRVLIVTMVATNPFHKVFGLFVFHRQRHTTGATKL